MPDTSILAILGVEYGYVGLLRAGLVGELEPLLDGGFG